VFRLFEKKKLCAKVIIFSENLNTNPLKDDRHFILSKYAFNRKKQMFFGFFSRKI